MVERLSGGCGEAVWVVERLSGGCGLAVWQVWGGCV